MGLQFLPLGLFKTVGIDASVPFLSAKPSPSSDFKRTLADAASRPKDAGPAASKPASQSSQPDTAAEPEKEKHAEETDEPTNAQAFVPDAAPQPVIELPAPVVPRNGLSNEQSTAVPIVNAELTSHPVDSDANAQAGHPNSANTPIATPATQARLSNAFVAAKPVAQQTQTADGASAERLVEAPSIISAEQRSDAAAVAAKDAAAATAKQAVANQQPTNHQAAPVREQVATTGSGLTAATVHAGKETRDGETNAVQSSAPTAVTIGPVNSSEHRELQDEAQDRPSDTAPTGETASERKVRRWIDSRREGSTANSDESQAPADGPLGLNRSQGPTADRLALHEVGVSKRSAGRIERPDRPILTSGHGDSTAASIARWLVQDAGEHDSAASNGGASPTATMHPGGSHATAGNVDGSMSRLAGNPFDIVAELMSSKESSAATAEQIAKSLQASGSPGRFHATMRLDPPDLGHLKVQIRMNGGALSLNVHAEHAGVARLVESRLSELRDALAMHGIRIEHSSVTQSPDSERSGNDGQSTRHDQQGQRGEDWSGRSSDAHDSWAQGRGWNGPDGDGSSYGHPSWQDGNEAAVMGDALTADEAPQWNPILEGSVDLVA